MSTAFATCNWNGCAQRATHADRLTVYDVGYCDFHARRVWHVHDANCEPRLLWLHFQAECAQRGAAHRHLDMGMGAFIVGVRNAKDPRSGLHQHRACDWERWYFGGLHQCPSPHLGVTRTQAIERVARLVTCHDCLVILDELLELARR